MRGREPIGYRMSERIKLFVALDAAIFIALIVIFFADFVHDFSESFDRFFVRIIAYQLIAMLAAIIASILTALRSNTWEAHDGVLVLRHWGELSGDHQVVGLRIQTGPDGKPCLEAVLTVGDVARLAKGEPERLEQLRSDLAIALNVSL